MSNLRIFWIIWCSAWALGWLLLGFLTIVTWVFVPLSLLAILLPVGIEGHPPSRAQHVLPACFRCGWPADAHIDGRCPNVPRAIDR